MYGASPPYTPYTPIIFNVVVPEDSEGQLNIFDL